MQLRIGPPILQPCYDFFKLLGKETIVPRAAARRAFLTAPYIGLISLVITALFIPIFGIPAVSGVADLIVILYLLTIPTVAVIIGGAASGSQYAGVGISREMVTVIAYELPLVMVLLAVGWKAGLATTGGITFSLIMISEFQAASGMMITQWSMIPAALALLLVIPAEVGSQPFDVAEAETEICEGPLVEYSGTPLAVFKLNHAIKMYIMTALYVTLFLGGRGLDTGNLVLNGALNALLLFIICALLTIICMSLIHAVTARLKVEVLFRFYWKIVTGLAGLSLVLVWLGI
jgi:NADH-quinone oxidoreductase subunit H